MLHTNEATMARDLIIATTNENGTPDGAALTLVADENGDAVLLALLASQERDENPERQRMEVERLLRKAMTRGVPVFIQGEVYEG